MLHFQLACPHRRYAFRNPSVTQTNIDITEPQHEISNNVIYATSKASDQPAHTRSLIRAFVSR